MNLGQASYINTYTHTHTNLSLPPHIGMCGMFLNKEKDFWCLKTFNKMFSMVFMYMCLPHVTVK